METQTTSRSSLLRARCQRIDHQSVLTERYHQAPLKVSKTFREPVTNALMLYMMDASPGMMEGDAYKLDIKLESQTHLVLTNQSFTKIHPAASCGASYHSQFTIGEGALLEYIPEPTIPYKDSIYSGSNLFYLEKTSSLIFVEMITPGRTHRNEIFQFAKYKSATEIYIEGQLVASDSFCLIPSLHKFAVSGVLEHYTHQAVMWIFSPLVKQTLLHSIREQLAACEACANNKLLAAVSQASSGGLVVRMLGNTIWEIQLLAQQIWDRCRIELWKMPPCYIRK